MTYTWREELAWAAGFFDGEGSTCYINNNNTVSLSIKQSDIGVDSLHRFQNAVLGQGKIYGPYREKKFKSRPFFQYRVGKPPRVQAVIAMLWTFLGDVKKQQAVDALGKVSWIGEGMCKNNRHLKEKQVSGAKVTVRNVLVKPGE